MKKTISIDLKKAELYYEDDVLVIVEYGKDGCPVFSCKLDYLLDSLDDSDELKVGISAKLSVDVLKEILAYLVEFEEFDISIKTIGQK